MCSNTVIVVSNTARVMGLCPCFLCVNVRMDLGDVGKGDVDRIGLAQDRNMWRALVNSVLNLWVP
jgi:hypothetical protein